MRTELKKKLLPVFHVTREMFVEPLLDKQKLGPVAERLLAKVDLAPRRCGICKHFNLSEGQRGIMEDPTMRVIFGTLTPDQYAAAQKHAWDATENTFDEGVSGTKLRPGKVHTWSQYGACTATRELVHEDSATAAGQSCNGGQWR